MNAVIEHRANEVVHVSQSQSLMEVISRAASDPNTDVDKLERLMAMFERTEARTAEQRFNEAMTAAQKEMTTIAADATNPQTRSNYATYAKLDSRLRPIYTKHGFALSFDEGESPKDEHVRVLCYVSHSGGFSKTYHKDMPADGKGAKGGDVMTKTHAAGAAQSYGMRYLLKGIFNVSVGEEDTDGNATDPVITENQRADLQALAEEVGADKGKFLAYLGIESLEYLRTSKYADAVSALRRKQK